MTLSKEWLEKAEKDLDAAKKLYASANYGNAVFHLQQATEKLAKGNLRQLNLLREGDTPLQVSEYFEYLAQTIIPTAEGRDGYGHAWQEKFFELLKNLIAPFRNKLPEATLTAYDNLLDKISNIPALIDHTKLEELINQTDGTILISKMSTTEILALSKSYGTTINKEDLESIKTMTINKARQTGVEIKQKLDENSVALAQLFTLVGLATLGAIFSPHESLSRYPNGNIKVVYDKNLPIIKNFNRLYDQIKYFKDFLKNNIH